MRRLFEIRRAILAMSIFCLAACATGRNKVALHSIEFDAQYDSSDIEVLDYKYGELEKVFFAPERERIRLGQTFKRGNLTGFLPRGEFLYVEWRIKETGEILEDLHIHFVCHGRQLYVFVRWPWDGLSWKREPNRDEYKPIPGGAKRYEGHKVQQIYPDSAQQ